MCIFHADNRKVGTHARLCWNITDFARASAVVHHKCAAAQQLKIARYGTEHVYAPTVPGDFKGSLPSSIENETGGPTSRRKAVVLDCKMVGVMGGLGELALVCAVDLFTAEVLINKLVQPNMHTPGRRTQYSAIRARDMALTAVKSNQAFHGWRQPGWSSGNIGGDTLQCSTARLSFCVHVVLICLHMLRQTDNANPL